MIDATKSWNYSRHANSDPRFQITFLSHIIIFVYMWMKILCVLSNITLFSTFSLQKVVFNFCLSNIIWHYYIIYLPMNKIFQLCFMFSQEIYIKLETLPSRKMKNIFLIFHFPEIPIFVTLFVI